MDDAVLGMDDAVLGMDDAVLKMDEKNVSNRTHPYYKHCLQLQNLRTGLFYDEKLLRHQNSWNDDYTERPERIKACFERMQELGLVDRCLSIPVRLALDEEISLCHTREHIERLKETKFMTSRQHQELAQKYDFMYFDQYVEENARLSAGGCIDLVDSVVTGKIKNGMAVIRPPGHHGQANDFCGYCYFNNIAISAKVAMKKHMLNKILIVDWDVHHGQGTQFMFYDDPRVLFISIHTYDHGHEWPHLRESDYDFTGSGPGKGYNVNIPLDGLEMEDSDYLSIFFNVVLPLAYEFQPELILVSAGYDAAVGCPEGEMSVSPACFAHFVNLLKPLAMGRMALLLEGGYCLQTLAESAALSLRALLGDPTPNIDPITSPRKSVVESMLNVIKVQRGTHKSLAFQDTLDKQENTFTWTSYLAPMSAQRCLRTQHNQPQVFPLIQNCYDSARPEVESAIVKKIQRLQRETVIVSNINKLGVIFYPLYYKNGRSEIVSTNNNASNNCTALSGCHQHSANSARAAVTAAMAEILSDKVRSYVLLPSVSVSHAVEKTEFHTLLSSLTDYLYNDFEIERVLILNFSSENSSIITDKYITNKGRALVLTIGTATDGGGDVSDKLDAYNISIHLSHTQLNDADIMAVLQQIILPVSYEYYPELLVVCFGQLRFQVPGEPIGTISTACFSHVLATVLGLARGRMIVLFSPDASENERLLSECSAALLGCPCSLLAPCVPQASTANVIKMVQDQYKSDWKTLILREKLPPPQQC